MRTRITTLFLILSFVPAFAAEKEFAAKQLRPVVLRVKAPKAAKSVRVQVTDVASGKVARLELNSRDKEWLQGIYLINFKEQSSPRLQFQMIGKNDTMYVVEDQSTSGNVVDLFETENEYVQFETAKVRAAEAKAAKEAKEARVKAARDDAEARRLQKLEDEKRAELERRNQKIQEEQRMKQEADEAERRAEAIRKQDEMSRAEKEKRLQQALQLIKEGDQAYAKGDFQTAVKKYEKAVELDPTRDEMYYRYAIALYRIDEYNKSLAMFSMAEGGVSDKAEYEYYLGLNHLKLKENEKALEEFVSSRDENGEISATSALLAGNLEFNKKKYTDARKSFEYVLDHSKDPKMDEQAEAMLDRIDKLENFQSDAKMGYALNLGLGYDGNVLSLASQNAPTDVAAYRGTWGASFFYKFYQAFDSDFQGQIAYSDVFSYDKSLKPDHTLQTADPMLLTVSAPYRKEFEGKDRNYTMNVTPSYGTITMNADPTDDVRKVITKTTSLAADVSFLLNASWYSAYRAEGAQDVSELSTVGTDDDQSSTRVTVSTTQTKILDAKEGKSLGGDLNYVMNNAKGKNTTYNKAILGLTYGFPGAWKSTANVRLEYMDMNYADNPSGRHDSGFTVGTSALKSLSKGLSLSLGLQYVNNASNIDDYKYDKMVVLTSLIYNGVLIK